MHADDIVLLTSSVTNLHALFNLRSSAVADLALPINLPKTSVK